MEYFPFVIKYLLFLFCGQFTQLTKLKLQELNIDLLMYSEILTHEEGNPKKLKSKCNEKYLKHT